VTFLLSNSFFLSLSEICVSNAFWCNVQCLFVFLNRIFQPLPEKNFAHSDWQDFESCNFFQLLAFSVS